MLILTPEDALRVTCSSAAAVHAACHYTDKSGTQNAPGCDLTEITTTDATAITTAPAIVYQKSGQDAKYRHIHAVSIANSHASTSTDVVVEIVRGGVAYRVLKATLAAGAKIQFNEGNGWA